MNHEYYEFRNGGRSSNSLFSTIIKSLAILVLLLLIVLLGMYLYKYISKDSVKVNTVHSSVVQQKKQTGLKKEDIALIVKSIILEMQAQQKKQPIVIHKNSSNDQQLLNSLQNAEVDTIVVKKVKVKKPQIKKVIAKKIRKKPKKKYVTYNAVIINKKEIKNTSDLAKLYTSINKIAKKNKKRILKSAYTKKIRKEIGTRRNSMRTIKVRKGDTLGSLAIRAYGDARYYTKIYDANPDLVANPNKIHIGQVLRVPR